MRTQASNILQVFRECLLSPLVNEWEMGGRFELRESHGGGMDCWHFCFDMNSIFPGLLLLLLLLYNHSFRCDVCLDQKPFHVYTQIFHRKCMLLSTLRRFLSSLREHENNYLLHCISMSTSETEYW